jgi:hypothetical protein
MPRARRCLSPRRHARAVMARLFAPLCALSLLAFAPGARAAATIGDAAASMGGLVQTLSSTVLPLVACVLFMHFAYSMYLAASQGVKPSYGSLIMSVAIYGSSFLFNGLFSELGTQPVVTAQAEQDAPQVQAAAPAAAPALSAQTADASAAAKPSAPQAVASALPLPVSGSGKAAGDWADTAPFDAGASARPAALAAKAPAAARVPLPQGSFLDDAAAAGSVSAAPAPLYWPGEKAAAFPRGLYDDSVAGDASADQAARRQHAIERQKWMSQQQAQASR